MSSRRTQKAAEAIREVVSMAILTELKDPRVRNVTVTQVEVTPDMRQAKVYVSIMGDDKQQKLVLHGLENSAGFLQSKVAKRIDTRYTPRLSFVLDLGVKRSIEIAQILQQVLPKQPSPDADPSDAGLADDGGDVDEADTPVDPAHERASPEDRPE
jgi:ribosome-binding factor A